MAQTIAQLDAPALARHAFNVFLYRGRHQKGARLIYRAIELDPREPLALRCLSDILDEKGTEQLSAVVLEYALDPSNGIEGEPSKELDDLLFLARWSWGFARHNSGDPYLPQEAFADRSAFTVDDSGYAAFLAGVMGPESSLEYGFRAAHTLCGTMGGLLVHRLLGAKADVAEVFHPERFEKTPAYADWLRQDTDELDALERARSAPEPARKPWWKVW